jgi:hypothetical protein
MKKYQKIIILFLSVAILAAIWLAIRNKHTKNEYQKSFNAEESIIDQNLSNDQSEIASTSLKTKSYTSSKDINCDFNFDYPEEWYLVENKYERGASLLRDSDADKFAPYDVIIKFSCVEESYFKGMDLKKITEEIVGGDPSSTYIGTEFLNHKAYKITSRAGQPLNGQKLDRKSEMYLFIANGKVYFMTYQTLPIYFDQYQYVFNNILKSFKLN